MKRQITQVRKLTLVVLLLFTSVLYTQTTVTMQTPCDLTGCGAQDVEIGSVFIGDSNGNPITTCTVGQQLSNVFLYVDISKASSKLDLYMQFYLMSGTDLLDKDGNVYQYSNPISSTPKISIGISGSINVGVYQMFELTNYTCGETFTLTDVYLSWQTPGSSSGPGCAVQKSKCSGENLPPIDVQTPIAPDFTTASSCGVNGFQSILFTNASTGGDGQLTYEWSFGADSSPTMATSEGPHNVSYTSSGSKLITLIVTDEDGDTNSISKNIFVDSTPSVSLVETDVKCNGGSDGSIDLTVTGGKSPFTYSWSNGATSEDISGLSVGNYSVTVTDANGCQASGNVSIGEPDALVLSLIGSDLSCGGSDGAVNLAVSGGVSPYSYSWTGAGGFSANTEDISGLIAGTYTVTVTDANGCEKTDGITLISNDNEDPIISVPETLSLEGCDENAITSVNARYPFSNSVSSDIKDTFITTGYTASDDGTIGSITYQDDITSNDGCEIVVTRTFTVTDTCGKTGTDTLVITINDTTNPTWTNEPMDMISVECDPATNAQTFIDWLASFNGTDSCGTATVTHNSIGLSDDCGETGTETVTFTLTDECGNSITKDATFTIIDTTNPVWTSEPTDMTSVACDPTTNAQAFSDWLESFSGTDSCCGGGIVTHNSTGLSDDCGGTGSETVTFTLTDECGNSITKDATFTIIDTTNPTWTNEPTDMVSVECDPATNAQAFNDWLASFSGTDSCGTATVTHNSTGLSDDCGGTGTETVTFTLTDECGNSITKDATFTIIDTTNPTWTNEPMDMTSVECDPTTNAQAFSDWLASFSGIDSCGTATVTHNSTGLSDDCGGTGTETVTFTLTDECGNSITKDATFTIIDTTNPTWTNEPMDMTSVECDPATNAQSFSDWLASFSGTDSCGTATVTHNSTGLSDDCGGTGTETVSFTLTDECGNSITKDATFTIIDTTNPIWTNEPSDMTSVACDPATNAQAFNDWLTSFSGTDSCGTATVTHNSTGLSDDCGGTGTEIVSFTLTDECGNSITKDATFTIIDITNPTWTNEPMDMTSVACDPATNAQAFSDWLASFSGTDSCGTATVTHNSTGLSDDCGGTGTETVSFTLTDECGNSITKNATFTIIDTTDPVVTVQAENIEVECDGSGNNNEIQTWLDANGNATATDSCGDVTWTNDYNGATSDCSSPVLVTFTVTDACGNSVTTSATYSIKDTVQPTITVQATDETVECDGSGNTTALQNWLDSNGGATATDDCSSVTWTNNFTEISNGCNSFNGSAIVTFRATDGCGNFSETTATFTIQDTIAPAFVEALPGNVTVSCDNIPDPVVLTATDGCDAQVDVNYTQTTSGDDDACPSEYVITRTWTVSDCSGNTTEHIQTLTIEDTTAPTFVEALPEDVTVSCDAIPEAAVLTATDNCDSEVTVNYSESFSGNDDECPSEYVITRTWNVSDCAGNITEHIQTLMIEDTTAPTFVEALPEDTTVSCDAIPEAAVLTVTDNCDSEVMVNYSESFSGNDDECPSEYVITRTWSVSDCAGNITEHIQTLTIEDTTAPTFVEALPEDTTVSCDAIPEAAVLTATDNCDAQVTVNYSESLSGNDDECPSEYVITRTWNVSDCAGNTTEHVQTLTIEDTTAPTFVEALPEDATVSCDAIPEAAVLTATDNCDAQVTVNYSESFSGNDDECPSEYVITRTWNVSDCAGNITEHVQTITIEDTVAPTFVEALPEDVTVSCDVVPEAAVLTATDNCDSEVTVNYSESFSGNDDECPSEYVITRTWSVSDCAGNITEHVQTLTIEDTVAPTFVEALPEDTTVSCDAIPETAVLTATDNCDSEVTVNYSESFSGNDDECPSVYTITRTWTVNDCAGNITEHIQTLTIEDTVAPTFVEALPEDITVSCDTIPEAAVLTATDNCDSEVTVNYSESLSGNDDECPSVYTITRTWSVSDCAGNITEHVQTLTIEDTTTPTFVEAVPEDITVSCDTIPEAAVLTATDNCDSEVTVNYNESFSGNDDECPSVYVITRTWTVSDCAGNITEHVQTINVEDTVAPTFVEALPENTTVSCDAIPEPVVLTATDNCDTQVNVVFNEEIGTSAEGCASSYTITRTWTVSDCAGNDTIHEQVITVEDTEAPTLITSLDQELTVECDVIPEIPVLEFEDNCSENVTEVSFDETSTFDGTDADYTITRVWIVRDDCGNTSEFTQTINVSVKDTVTEVSDSKCIDDGVVDLNDYLNNSSTDGTWEVVSGNVLLESDGTFDPQDLILGDYLFSYTVPNEGCLVTTRVSININDDCIVLPCGQEDVVISKAVTPNGDQWNENFEVTGVDGCGFIAKVQIFNRWGSKVYESNNYRNDWNGITDGASFGAATRLPAGTYYYIVELANSGIKPFTGAIYLGTN